MRRSLVVAVDHDLVIGRDGGLPWKLQGELALFRRTTIEQAVIMGRRTWESLPVRPLAGRANIVLTRSQQRTINQHYSTQAVGSLAEAFDLCQDLAMSEAFVIGGRQVYAEALPVVERVYLTVVDGQHPGDTYFPHDILQDGDWAWDLDRVGGAGWTRYVLNRL